MCDIDLRSSRSIRHLENELGKEHYQGAKRLFVLDATRSTDAFQASRLGACATVRRPIHAEQLLSRLRSAHATSFTTEIARTGKDLAAGLTAAQSALVKIFEGVPAGRPIEAADVADGEAHIPQALLTNGLERWLETVWRHHSASYRHCFSVTGIVVSFAQRLGMGEGDQKRLAQAALVHDVGKAFIPLSILDKPGKLTKVEMAVMRKHARLGHDLLARTGSFSSETLDAVLSHHELLDGSGYPNGSSGGRISDFVRILTIADIFSALIEERSYKPAMPRATAYGILAGMVEKLDPDLVREFRTVAIPH